MFRKQPAQTTDTQERIADFDFLSKADVYMDTACQSLRPLPVQKKLQEYYTAYNACGGRVKYVWGQQVDDYIAKTRQASLDLLGLSSKSFSASFTLNTTYGINLLLSQLPKNVYKQIVTSEIEHNSVFLPTIEASNRLGIPRVVLPREDDGTLLYKKTDLEKAIVIVNAVSNIDGRRLENIKQLVADVHSAGGHIIIDAAQAMAHSYELLKGIPADAFCFSAHKMYGPSLGIVVANREFMRSLVPSFVGGGMVTSVAKEVYELAEDEESRLEPGLQAFGEIVAANEAINWLMQVRPYGHKPTVYMQMLSEQLYNGLLNIPSLQLINTQARPVITFYSSEHDAHRLATFLSGAGIMTRSGYFCCHYYLQEKTQSPPLVRLSLGLHNTKEDVDFVLDTLKKLHRKGK